MKLFTLFYIIPKHDKNQWRKMVINGKTKKPWISSRAYVRAEGFEPSTLGAEIRYSIQLNYARLFINQIKKL